MFTKHTHTLRLHPRSPSLQLFATGAKLLQKEAKVKIPPCEATISISSQFTGVSLPLKVSIYSSSRLGLDWPHQWEKKKTQVKWAPPREDFSTNF